MRVSPLPALFSMLIVLAVPTAARAHDLAWWHAQPAESRDEFVAGWLDCYAVDAAHPTGKKLSLDALATAANRVYLDTPAARTAPIGSILESRARLPEFSGKGATLSTDHGIFDGDYWRQIDPPTARIAYILGYAECREQYLHDPLPKSPEFYASAVSRYFGISDTDPSELNPATANKSIASAISKARRVP